MCRTVPSSAGGWAGAAPGCGGGAGGMTPHAHSGRFGGTGLAGAGACCASAYPLTTMRANATRARWIFLIRSPPATACTCRSGRSLAHRRQKTALLPGGILNHQVVRSRENPRETRAAYDVAAIDSLDERHDSLIAMS